MAKSLSMIEENAFRRKGAKVVQSTFVVAAYVNLDPEMLSIAFWFIGRGINGGKKSPDLRACNAVASIGVQSNSSFASVTGFIVP